MAAKPSNDVDDLAVSLLNVNMSKTSPVLMDKVSFSKQISHYINLFVLLLPCIVAINIFVVSIILLNLKGFVYLGFLTASYVCRVGTYSLFEMFNKQDYQLSKGYNCGISLYLLSFTFAYICLPMLFLKNINIMVFAVLLLCIFIDLFYKSANLCDLNLEAFFNILGGMFFGFVSCFLMHMGGSSKYLFFSELSSKEICSVPQKQKFKCSVFKNGELVKM
jgi:hypothetical protein